MERRFRPRRRLLKSPRRTTFLIFEQLLGYYFKGQYGRAWDLLHPGHQAVVSRTKFDECVGAAFPSTAELTDVEVVEVYDEPIDAMHVPEKTSKAVTLKITVSSGLESASDTDTYHAIDLGGRWAWVLEAQDVAAYERGECPPPSRARPGSLRSNVASPAMSLKVIGETDAAGRWTAQVDERARIAS